MGRRNRTQDSDETFAPRFPAAPKRSRNRKPPSAQPKQTHRQRAADGQAAQQFDTSLQKLLPTRPLSETQAVHLKSLAEFRINLATGPSGTGKTFCPVAHALDLLADGAVQRIIFLRPTVEAGQPLGFLPGKLEDKIEPFFAPIRRSIGKKLGNPGFAERWITAAKANNTLSFTSIQHLRGETLENCFVHLDEAQNASYAELKMVITRLGGKSHFSFGGDSEQSDLPGSQSGWLEFVARLAPVSDVVAVTRYTDEDVVRDPLLKRILPYL